MIRIVSSEDDWPWIVEVNHDSYVFDVMCDSFKEAVEAAMGYEKLPSWGPIELWADNERIPFKTEQERMMALLLFS